MKDPKCKICGGPHYQTFCYQKRKKPILVTPKMSEQIITAITKSPVKRTRSTLIREADKVFSIYIRRKDAKEGNAMCVTCGLISPWVYMQNGHFIPRSFIWTRWDEENCHVQCPYCNENLSGNLVKYKQYLIRKFGSEIIARLKIKSKRNEKFTIIKIQETIDYYNQQIRKFEN